jgi:hypothetical protein
MSRNTIYLFHICYSSKVKRRLGFHEAGYVCKSGPQVSYIKTLYRINGNAETQTRQSICRSRALNMEDLISNNFCKFS